VLVEMNQWSRLGYALAVREAVDIWIRSIWTYSDLYNDTTLGMMNYTFYVSNINATSSYDIFITFTSDEISAGIVGLTTYKWNPITHAAKPPVTINITTYSGTASLQFLKNVAMHEFGHSLGLGHASSMNTQNGPEIMYFQMPTHRTVYPSTLDIYALTVLSQGDFSQSVQLPTSIPYEMVQPKTNRPPDMTPNSTQPGSDQIVGSILKALSVIVQHIWETERTYLIILAVLLLVFVLASRLGKEH
jgi:hypothetical protein